MKAAFERAVRVAEDYANGIPAPSPKDSRNALYEKSISRWAARTLLYKLYEAPDMPPLITMEDFWDQLKNFSEMNPKTERTFRIGYETVDTIIRKLLL